MMTPGTSQCSLWFVPSLTSRRGCHRGRTAPRQASPTLYTEQKKLWKKNNNWFLISYSPFLVLMKYFSKRFTLYYYPVTGFNINPAVTVHLLNSLGSILARWHFGGAHMPNQVTNNFRILPDRSHLYTWVESTNVDKVSSWRTKGATGNENQTRVIKTGVECPHQLYRPSGRSHLFSVQFQREHVLGYTPFLVVWTGSKESCFQLEHGQTMFSEQITPLVHLQNAVWTMWNREHVLTGRGLARRPLSARRVHVNMTSHVAQCIHVNKSHCALRRPRCVPLLNLNGKGYREHFTVLAIWTLVYWELVSRTFCRGRHSCTENIYERAPWHLQENPSSRSLSP